MSEIAAWANDITRGAVEVPRREHLFIYAGSAIVYRSGLWCEFGVGDGSSLRYFAPWCSAVVHGFDCFLGLPEDSGRPDGKWKQGEFGQGGIVPDCGPNVKFHVGFFADTIPLFLEEFSEPAAFLHIDCDLYSSTKTVLTLMQPRITLGTVLLFDEFWKYEGWETVGEGRAMFEFCRDYNVQVECLGVNEERVLLRVLEVRA